MRIADDAQDRRIGLKEQMPETCVGAIPGCLKGPLSNFRDLRKLSHFDDNGHRPWDIIWALKDVSLKVKPGEVVGIIGRNGGAKAPCSKSCPASPSRPVGGIVLSLLKGGHRGFHSELTGRTSIYLIGTSLGMARTDISRKFS